MSAELQKALGEHGIDWLHDIMKDVGNTRAGRPSPVATRFERHVTATDVTNYLNQRLGRGILL